MWGVCLIKAKIGVEQFIIGVEKLGEQAQKNQVKYLAVLLYCNFFFNYLLASVVPTFRTYGVVFYGSSAV